jgi:dipeptidyl aminopeptidase/acylaminoacyl peptidase
VVIFQRQKAAKPALIALALLAAQSNVSAAKRELTPADAVATVRVMENQLPGSSNTNEHTSPDGRRYLLRLAYGDVKRNGVWMDLYTGSLDSLDAAQPRLCAHLFTTGLGSTTTASSADEDAEPSNEIRWLGSTQIALLWSDARNTRQVLEVNLNSCKRRWLTHTVRNVYSFAITPDGTLLFNVQAPEAKSRSTQLWKSGFTVDESANGWSILNGRIDGTSDEAIMQNSWFIQSPQSLRSVKIGNALLDPTVPYDREVSVSPGNRYAIITVAGPRPPEDWDHYINPGLQRSVVTNRTARSLEALIPIRDALIDLREATSRMLWNAPQSWRGRPQWSPKGDHLLLAPTFLPPDDNHPLGLTGNAAVVLDVTTGSYRVLPTDLTDRNIVRAQWRNSTTTEISTTSQLGNDLRIERFVLTEGQWQRGSRNNGDPADTDATPHKPRIDIQTRQSLNSPPRIFAVDPRNAAERLLIDTNPHLLDTFKLGRVERMSGKLSNGKEWIAQLMYPADFQAGKTYPLVIQSMYGRTFGPENFSLLDSWGNSGLGLGPSNLAAYPGQLLATRNIAVLQLSTVGYSPDDQQGADYQLAFETLAEQLSASGLIDRNRIALDGFSQNGYWVEYTLTHSDFPFAAAVASDNYDPSYFQSALTNWREVDVLTNGGAKAFGSGLQEWFKRAPGFNADHINTPLRLIGQSGGVEMLMAKWEIYSRLRALHKPVEFYMMPEANIHPSHVPQNPRQIMAIQEGVVDWFSFWLIGSEDTNPAKREQYHHWHTFSASPVVSQPQL